MHIDIQSIFNFSHFFNNKALMTLPYIQFDVEFSMLLVGNV